MTMPLYVCNLAITCYVIPDVITALFVNIDFIFCMSLFVFILVRRVWLHAPPCPGLTVASKFARFEFSWLQRAGNTAREGVQNTHH